MSKIILVGNSTLVPVLNSKEVAGMTGVLGVLFFILLCVMGARLYEWLNESKENKE